MFFDAKVDVRLRKRELDEIELFLRENGEFKGFSQVVRASLMKFIREYKRSKVDNVRFYEEVQQR